MTGNASLVPGTPGTAEASWLSSRKPAAETAVDIYCFAPAGGSAGEFLRWSGGLTGIRLWAVKMPGRPPREAEPPYTRMTDLVGDLLAQVDFGRREFAFFGHSLGALVAFEVTRALRRKGRRLPRQLFVSSMQPPPLGVRKAASLLPGEEFLGEIQRRWGALPQEVSSDPVLRERLIGYLRADARIAETYRYRQEEPLQVPITAFAGDQQDRAQLGWQAQSSAGYPAHTLRGGHFYFRDQEQRAELLRLISQALTAEE